MGSSYLAIFDGNERNLLLQEEIYWDIIRAKIWDGHERVTNEKDK